MIHSGYNQNAAYEGGLVQRDRMVISEALEKLLNAFDDATDAVEHHERRMKRAAALRRALVREMLKHATIADLSNITGLRCVRLHDLADERKPR